jgi:hypothetical protein
MKLGTAAAFAAEAALWISGAALIASAAGMSWNVDVNGLIGSEPSASASVGPSSSPLASASPTVVVESLAPGASPTMSPVVKEYLAYVARPDFQFKAKFTNVTKATVAGSPWEMDMNGTISYKGGDDTDSHREIVSGAVTTYDYVNIGSDTYESKNSGPWTKTARTASSIASDALMFSSTLALADKGVETKNGAQLHRLEADHDVFTKAEVKYTTGATEADVNFTIWVTSEGIPAAYEYAGWVVAPVSGKLTKVETTQDLRVFALSGVSISAPI